MSLTTPVSFVTAASALDEVENDKLDKELNLIRQRREGDKRFFRGAFEDYTLIVGLIIGAVFFGGVFVMSSGWIAADSIIIDKNLSKTPLDSGEECVDREGQIWFNIFFSADEHVIEVKAYNIDSSNNVVELQISNDSWDYLVEGELGVESLSMDPSILADGHFEALVLVRDVNYSNEAPLASKNVGVEVSSHSSGPFSSEVKQKVEVEDDSPRSCWTIEGLGEWGWILMGAEWVGGREAAMLTGGNAGIPAWWLAMVSLGMSLFFLCVQYPLMQKMYHRDTDDLLTETQLRRLIQRILRKSTENLRIDIDFEKMKMQERAISIDVLIPYTTRSTTISEPIDIRAVLTRSLLEEFAVFGEMRPLQMRLMCIDDGIHEAHESSLMSLKIGNEKITPLEDYSSFFTEMSAYGWLEAAAHTSMNRWFKKHDLVDYGTAVLADEDAVFVRVIYQPVMRFSYFFFKPTFTDLQNDLHDHLKSLSNLILKVEC